MHTEPVLRPFRDDDDAVVSLWRACGLTRSWNDPRRDIARKRGRDDDLFLVAVAEDTVVGTVMGGYDGHRGWVNYLAVHPSWRRRGLGERLMNEVERRLLGLGCPKINLQVRDGNDAALAFYGSIGYAIDPVTSFGKRLVDDEAPPHSRSAHARLDPTAAAPDMLCP